MPLNKKRHVTLKILLFLVSIDLLEVLAQFCLKKSTFSEVNIEVHSFVNAVAFIKTVLPSGYLWAGLCSIFLIFVMWSTVLSKIDLSVAVPISSFSYIFIPFVSMVFLHERISPVRWIGIVIILCGVILVSVSSMHKKGQHA